MKAIMLFIVLFLLSCSQNPPATTAKLVEVVKDSSTVESSQKVDSANLIVDHYKQLKFPELKYIPPNPKDYRVKLAKGAVGYFVPDSSIALTEITVFFKKNNMITDENLIASFNLYNSLLVDGGTASLTPEQVEDSLEFVAASVSAGLGDKTSSMSVSSMSKDVYPLINMLEESVLKPRLDKKIFDLNKSRSVKAIEHRFDKPNTVMSIAFSKVMYPDHPRNWMSQLKQMKALKHSQTKQWKGIGFKPDSVVVAVSGMYNHDSMVQAVNNLLIKLDSNSKEMKTKDVPLNPAKKPGIYLVDKEFKQATVRVGFPGIQRPHPDYYKLVLANYIFGAGGFTSKLTAKVRTEHGLAYTARSFVSSSYFIPATCGFYLQTKVASTGKALSLSFEEMQKQIENGITQEELDRAKKGLIQSLPSIFDSKEATASIFARSELWGRNLDHFEKYPQILQSLTLKEVNEVFKKYFKPDQARIVIVGQKKEILPQIPDGKEGDKGVFSKKFLFDLKQEELEAN